MKPKLSFIFECAKRENGVALVHSREDNVMIHIVATILQETGGHHSHSNLTPIVCSSSFSYSSRLKSWSRSSTSAPSTIPQKRHQLLQSRSFPYDFSIVSRSIASSWAASSLTSSEGGDDSFAGYTSLSRIEENLRYDFLDTTHSSQFLGARFRRIV